MGKKTIVILVIIVTGIFFVFFINRQSPVREIPKGGSNLKGGGNVRISSPAFQNNQSIPPKHTCDGEDVNPQLVFGDFPAGVKSLALIVDDPDASAGDWVHWLVWNISPETAAIAENSVPEGAVEGTTVFGRPGWGGPCPPSGVHHYRFNLYALDMELNIPSSYLKTALEKAMAGHILDQAVLVGLYQRN